MTTKAPAPFFVRPDEDVALHERPAGAWVWALFFPRVVPLMVLAAGAWGLFTFVDTGAPALVVTATWAVLVLLALIALFWSWRRCVTSEYVITNVRVYARVGRFRTHIRFTTHDRVTDLDYDRGVFDRLFGVSHLTIRTAGGDVRLAGVRNALAVKQVAEDERDAFVDELIGELESRRTPLDVAAARTLGTGPPAEGDPARSQPVTGPRPPAWDGPVPPYLKRGEVPTWFGKPRLAPAVATVFSMLGLLAFAFVGIGFGPLGFVAGLAIASGLIIAVVWFRILQLKRMEFVVTDRRVYVRRGVVGTSVKQLTYDKITDISYDQDVLGRVLGYGTVTVNTAGSNEAPVRMVGLGDPLEAKERIEAARARALGEEARP